PAGVSKNGLGNRPYRAALRIEAAAHENGGRLPKVRKGSLRDLARQALNRARNNTAALEHVANRLDGPVIPSPDDPPSEQIVEIRAGIVEADRINQQQLETENATFADIYPGNESKLIEGEKLPSPTGVLQTTPAISIWEMHNQAHLEFLPVQQFEDPGRDLASVFDPGRQCDGPHSLLSG